MKRMPAFGSIIFLFSLLLMTINSVADTGTYHITDYSVALNPRPNGEVVMDYSQTWQVTGGHIPWVTVGLANADYKITGWGGAAKMVRNGNDGSWYGARVDLNRDYLPGEKFTYNFTIIQNNLIDSRSDGNWMVFTPGWYDRSSIEEMSIKVISPVDLKNVSAYPVPSDVEGRTLLFIKNNMGMGEKFKISIKFPKNAFNAIKSKASSNESSNSDNNDIFAFLIIVVFIIFILIQVYYEHFRNQDDGYQDYSGPVISSGSVRRGSRAHDRHDTGGSGGFGGRASSCACVSCDCACACACAGGGGGGAGCAKKWLHFCNRCDDPEYSDADAVKGKEEPGESK